MCNTFMEKKWNKTLKESKIDGDSRKRQKQVSDVEVDSDVDEIEEESHEADLWKKRSIFFLFIVLGA